MSAFLNSTTAAFTALCTLIGVIAGAMIRTRAPLAKINAEREANLLSERAKEMEEMRAEIKDLAARLDLALEEVRVLRHDLNNANQSLDLFIALIEANPERAAEHAARVKKSREEAQARIGAEKDAVAAARLELIKRGQP